MSLLDTFLLQFTVDAEQAISGTDELSASLDQTTDAAEESAAALEQTSAANTELAARIQSTVKNLLKATIGFQALNSAMSLAGITDALGKFSALLGQSVEDINAIGEATKRQGGSLDAFKGSISGLQKSLTDLSLTGGGEIASVLARLGINALDSAGKAKDAVSLLPEIARSFQGMSKSESLGLGQMLGLDTATIALLQKGEKAFKQAVGSAKALGVTTAEDAAAAAEFETAWADLTQIMVKARTTINTLILPVLTSIIDIYTGMTTAITRHKNLVIGAFAAISAIMAVRYLPVLIKVAAATYRVVAANIALIAPYLLIGAAIAGVAFLVGALIEDFIAFGNGQDSLLGRLAEKWPTFGKILHGVFDGIKAAIDAVGKSFEWLMGLWDKLDFSSFDKLTSSLGEIVGLGGDDNEESAKIQKTIDILSKNDQAAASVNAVSAVNNTSSQRSQQNNTTVGKIEVKVSSPNADPNAVASAVGDQLAKQLAMANASNSSGVM